MKEWDRIIVAIDDSQRSFNAVEYVGFFVHPLKDVHLCLLHVYPEPPPNYHLTGTVEEYIELHEQHAGVIFSKAKSILHGYGIAATAISTRCFMADHTSISAAILDMQVREHYGTIVVGKRGIPKAEEFLFGSISSALVHTGKDIAVWVVG